MALPSFSLTNPNRVRAVVGAFTMLNHKAFHAVDGSGYAFTADCVLELDKVRAPRGGGGGCSRSARLTRLRAHARALRPAAQPAGGGAARALLLGLAPPRAQVGRADEGAARAAAAGGRPLAQHARDRGHLAAMSGRAEGRGGRAGAPAPRMAGRQPKRGQKSRSSGAAAASGVVGLRTAAGAAATAAGTQARLCHAPWPARRRAARIYRLLTRGSTRACSAMREAVRLCWPCNYISLRGAR